MARRLRSVLGSAPRRRSAKACKASPRACAHRHRRIPAKSSFTVDARDRAWTEKILVPVDVMRSAKPGN